MKTKYIVLTVIALMLVTGVFAGIYPNTIFGSYVVDAGEDIQDIIDTAQTAGKHHVIVSDSEYTVTKALFVPNGMTLECTEGTQIRPSGNHHVVNLDAFAQIKNCIINVSEQGTFTSAGVIMNNTDVAGLPDEYSKFLDIDYTYWSATPKGTAFLFQPSTSGAISYSTFDIDAWGADIVMRMDMGNTNANHFNGNIVKLTGQMSNRVLVTDMVAGSSHFYNNMFLVDYQDSTGINTNTTGALMNFTMASQGNIIEGWFWDLDTGEIPFYFNDSATRNYARVMTGTEPPCFENNCGSNQVCNIHNSRNELRCTGEVGIAYYNATVTASDIITNTITMSTTDNTPLDIYNTDGTAGLHYDASNKRLGIKDATPDFTLDVEGSLNVEGSTTLNGNSINMGNGVINNIGNGGTDFASGGGLTLADTLTISTSGNSITLKSANTSNFCCSVGNDGTFSCADGVCP